MVTRVQTLRSSTSGAVPAAATRAAGELWTNFPDLQLGVIDASRTAQKLIAVRFFSATAIYAAGDFVIQAGKLYFATGAVPAGAFNAAQWTQVAALTDIPALYVLPTASTTVLGGVKVDGATITISSGVISSAGLVTVSATAPSPVQNGALWYDLVGGQLYVWMNDGSSSQWVVAVNQSLGGVYLPMTGGVLTGPLTLSADAVSALQPVTLRQLPVAATTTPLMDGTAAAGSSVAWSRGDHVHPSDTSLAPLANPNFSGIVKTPALTIQVGTSYIGPGNALITAENASGNAAFFYNSGNGGAAVTFRTQQTATNYAIFQWSNSGTGVGYISTNGTATTYGTSSDYRLKTVHGDASALVGAMLDSVPVHDAEFKAGAAIKAAEGNEHCYRYPMFLAHELQAACPWAVVGAKDAENDDGSIAPQQVDASHVVAVLWAEVRNLRVRVAQLEGGVR